MTVSRLATLALRMSASLLLVFAAAAAAAQGRFTVSGDGQDVLDTSTQLTWRRCAEGMQWDGKTCAGKASKFTLVGARERARAGAAGATAWRLPSREELVGLVDRGAKKKPRIDGIAFPKTPALPFWATRTGSDDNLNAWLVSFANGKVTGNVGEAKFPLRLVRAGR
ncbi:MAG: DUF1566 domain-containing protein [Pseudomonadota bacterium]|nr:DUF1566 domain-containing protein [Pseudomonadota bacterium]